MNILLSFDSKHLEMTALAVHFYGDAAVEFLVNNYSEMLRPSVYLMGLILVNE